MKKILMLAVAALILASGAQAQGSAKGKKGDSPYISGKQKIRESEPDVYTFDRFTPFSTKDMKRYFCPFDYTRIPALTQQQRQNPDWGDMQPVMNYLEKSSRAVMTVCALYAVNPEIDDPEMRKQLANQAARDAKRCLDAFDAWKVKKEWRNKIQYYVAEIDYRYFKGAGYYNAKTDDEIIHVGLMMYFGSKKKPVFEPDTNTRTFPDIKFFPNDATIVESWMPVIDEVVNYLENNEKRGVLLTGYSDNHGTEAYSMGVSRQRAMEVKKALIARGIQENRIEVEALGDADPVGDNSDKEAFALNNRVSIKVQ